MTAKKARLEEEEREWKRALKQARLAEEARVWAEEEEWDLYKVGGSSKGKAPRRRLFCGHLVWPLQSHPYHNRMCAGTWGHLRIPT